jgi:hypothetical protein
LVHFLNKVMAHSNRKKIREKRGGKTRHQMFKAARKAKNKAAFDPQERIRELNVYILSLSDKKKAGDDKSTKKGKTFSTKDSVKARRKKVFDRLHEQLKSGKKVWNNEAIDLDENDINRINREKEILMKRV